MSALHNPKDPRETKDTKQSHQDAQEPSEMVPSTPKFSAEIATEDEATAVTRQNGISPIPAEKDLLQTPTSVVEHIQILDCVDDIPISELSPRVEECAQVIEVEVETKSEGKNDALNVEASETDGLKDGAKEAKEEPQAAEAQEEPVQAQKYGEVELITLEEPE